ncbi:hypothetical protein A3G67_01735 [Candidatus Roizmanbacteria bacterium RIFCSPLOWO2_12_FULL_40_12]|uniref:Uncharacterized protein n=1 Tax=Candidatus Roizmanbacteria bacterium RIFCSPLOWO2_01_FULL_40_42 TaxID=1802066 RepID=A0A1F7J1X6_9BACT|nr:MAG: hypothetical protein A2779_00185 [Candidatus Roizmanbacteria bacterium RIFCSPHIGHO2_01_FULL_40_98]OGK27698.1 MAG: hypothetical protein A3C31_04245 [Candidatus Roizmanbacteria bacterium RIFCSPHIGHO2_02_FULL_40_53]OGK29917.1 MAG: hypothetical protein A2W49_04505 [Candidatus Roizmanbacteria bacterium RIFCSPHIGHO2_12_41_18]OGK36533.1 MAG: hypothetical protein A3E69_04575 [Candidatus Roizmanbacteria bacterium RIFCSPHIGHO2_12_FULL_40_130]OGK49612.1 MAG: hypothetical protein A3B50_04125 [Candi
MAKKKNIDVLHVLAEFQKNILEKKPTMDKMYDEVQMMHFKIRPLQGDVSLLNLSDTNLIEALWNLGKLDEFFRTQKDQLTQKQKQIFFQFLENLYDQFQDKLSNVRLKPIEEMQVSSSVEMEIFKEESQKKFN